MSLGTGLGFSLSRDGRVLCNPAGGPKVVIFDLPYRDGILEDYASKRGFLRIYGELTGRTNPALTVADLGRMAGEGDARACETFATVGVFWPPRSTTCSSNTASNASCWAARFRVRSPTWRRPCTRDCAMSRG